MGKGRKPTPTKLRVVRGNPSKRPIEENEVDAAPIERDVEPPVQLIKAAREKWDRITKNLEAVGLLTVMDMDVLARYCEMLVEYEKAAKYVRNNGTTAERLNQYGSYEVTAPQFNTMVRLNGELLKIETQFGFTPSARSGLIGPLKDETKDQWENFLYGSIEEAKKKA